MVSNGPVPWYDRPARAFPAKRWVRERYPFAVSPLVFARLGARPAGVVGRRAFPARVWLAERYTPRS